MENERSTAEWSRPLRIDREVAAILDKALAGEDISVDEGVTLFEADGPSVTAVMLAAAAVPARRATRLNPVRALRSE